MSRNSVGARPPLPQLNQRRFVPINHLYHDFNAQSKDFIDESMGSVSKENYNYQLDDLNWQDLLATVNQRQEANQTSKLVKVTPVSAPSPMPPPPPSILLQPRKLPPASTPTPPPTNSQAFINFNRSSKNIVYPINVDPQPQIVHRRSEQKLQYTQEVAVRYLKPSTPQPPGDIIIKAEENSFVPPAPPIVIRQIPPRPRTPPPLIIREKPPSPPQVIPRKVITITKWGSGHSGPPPPRKVIVERLPQLPPKPRSVIIERWLPYEQQKRKVIYRKGAPKPAVVLKPKNVIIQWEPPETTVCTRFRDLGTVIADPNDYMRRFGDSVIEPDQLPNYVRKLPPPKGKRFAADLNLPQTPPPLYGDLHALRLIDLDREGLGEYKPQLVRTPTGSHMTRIRSGCSRSTSATNGSFNSNGNRGVSPLIQNIFSNINLNRSGHISIDEMNKTFSKLNNCLGRDYGKAELNEFFKNMDSNRDGYVDLAEFKNFFKKNIV